MGLQKRFSALMAAVFFMVVFAAAQSPAPAPSAASDCITLVTTLAPCLGYVTTPTNETKPASGCCTALAAVVARNATCLCMILDPNNSLGLSLNMTRAKALPGVCNVKTPPLSQCGTALANSPMGTPGASPAGSPIVTATPPASSPTTASPAVSPAMSPSKSTSPSPAMAPSVATPTPASAEAATSPTPAPTSEGPTTSPSPAASPQTSPAPNPSSNVAPGSSPPTSTTPPSPPSLPSEIAPTPAPTGGNSTNAASTFIPSITFLTLAALGLAAMQF